LQGKMYKLSLIFILLFSVVMATAILLEDEEKDQFNYFVRSYGKEYKDEHERHARFKIFQHHLRTIDHHNDQPNVKFVLSLNQFADLNNDEYRTKVLSPQLHLPQTQQKSILHSMIPPSGTDWRTVKPPVVAPVRDIGPCGSAVANSIVDAIAGEYAVAQKDEVYVFNTSYVTDCDGGACTAQTSNLIWTFVENYGLWWFYDQCPDGPGVGICISGHNCTTNEVDLAISVSSVGPISVLIDASQPSFQFYASGVYSDPKCATNKPNHSLQVVGYGTNNGQDYWIARNSWGTNWGMNGDILIARNKGNMCGIASSACFAAKPKNCVCLEE